MVVGEKGIEDALECSSHGWNDESKWKHRTLKKMGMYGFDERGKETREDRSIVKGQRGMND